jgi:hypothetical protein
MARKSSSTQPAEVSPRIIRAWFDTVLNPLLYGLSIESDALSQGNLTWRLRTQSPVSLVPVRSLLMDLVQANLDQFLSLHSECIGPIQEHDAELARLVECCRKLHAKLIASEEMQATFRRLTTPGELRGATVDQIFGAVQPHDWLSVLAEYMINDIGQLSDFYSTADFWNEHGAEFLKLRTSEEIRPFWEDVVRAKDRFSHAVEQLISVFKQVRNDLSLSAGVPIVERLPH